MPQLPYRQREIAPLLKRLLTQFPVVVVSGLRQTGKSTLLKEEAAISRDRTYVILAYQGDQVLPWREKIWAVPLSVLLA